MTISIKQRRELVAKFGGKCERCGYDRCRRALQFHHNDPSEKKAWSGDRGGASLAEVRAHPKRFVLLCANCHFEEHERLDEANKVTAKCQHCQSRFPTTAYRLVNRRGVYCSKDCQFKHRSVLAETNLVKRFWSHVNKTHTCWLWTAYLSTGGTPIFQTHRNNQNKVIPARRFAWELIHGTEPPTQLKVICGNPRCVRPHPNHVIQRTKKEPVR